MIAGIIILSILSLAALSYTYKAWGLPLRVKLENAPFEPGRDNEVSAQEMRRRSVWRYDSWTDRIMSLMCVALLIVFWILAFHA